MLSSTTYSRLEVDIKKLKYTTDEGVVIPRTAIVTFWDKDNTKSLVELYGYLSEEEIFDKIDKGEEININHCYIDHFSMKNYRQTRKLEEKEMVQVEGFCAKKAFFETRFGFDFSFLQFNNQFDIEYAQFAGSHVSLSFQGSVFNAPKTNFGYVRVNDGEVNFTNCKFNQGVIFKNAKFSQGSINFQDTEFGEGNVDFLNTRFGEGDVSFINCQFQTGKVTFKLATFGEGKIDFHFAKFGQGDISFERTEFGNGKVDFRAVEFGEGKMNFNRSTFGAGEVSFEGCQMKGKRFYFKRAEFGDGSVDFKLAEFNNTELILDSTYFGRGDVSFYNANFNKLSLNSCHLDGYMDLRVKEAEEVSLADTIVRDIVDLSPYEFEVKIHTLILTGMKLLGRIYIDWTENHVRDMILHQKGVGYRSTAEQFRVLKQNSNVTGHYTDEDKAYVEFKRFEAKAILQEAKLSNKLGFLYAYPSYWVKWLIFDKVGLYATNPMRVLGSMIGVLLFFSLMYFILPFVSDGRLNSMPEVIFSLEYLGECIYYSGITFFTVGYGDISPLGYFRAMAVFEGFVGVFMMTYFSVAFVRKILR